MSSLKGEPNVFEKLPDLTRSSAGSEAILLRGLPDAQIAVFTRDRKIYHFALAASREPTRTHLPQEGKEFRRFVVFPDDLDRLLDLLIHQTKKAHLFL